MSGKRDDVVLLSIDERFAEQIYNGKKRFEFRKTPLPKGIEYVVLLENDSRKITGGFTVGEVHEREIQKLWNDYGKGISDHDRFFQYYSGWEEGLAIEVAEAERYEHPFGIDELAEGGYQFEVPQQFHFIYMPNRILRKMSSRSQYLGDYLPATEETTLQQYNRNQDNQSELNFRPMREEEEGKFRELFLESPVPKEYADITSSFVDHIINSHQLGEDPYGYFTLRKCVYSLFAGGDLIGFTTTTWKRGGSVKYGPTILQENQRGKGYGPKLRKLIDSNLEHNSVRKTYSTIPETSTSAYKYLIKSGYVIEAHLYQQYTEKHSELVFGKVLRGANTPTDIVVERNNIEEIQVETGSETFDEFRSSVKNLASPWYDEIDDGFVTSVEQAEKRGLDSQFSKKGKRVYIGHTSGNLNCIAICSKKRGDSVKVSPILTRIDGEGLDRFLDFVEEDLKKIENVRKLYTHVPMLDNQLNRSLRVNGFRPEGILREPYKGGINMLVQAKMLKNEY